MSEPTSKPWWLCCGLDGCPCGVIQDDDPIDYTRLFAETEWSTFPMPDGWRPTIDLAPEAGAGHG